VAATRNDRAGCADPAACVALLDTLDVADVARPTLARQGRRRGPGKKCIITRTQNLQVITIHNCLCCMGVLCTWVKLLTDLSCTKMRLAAGLGMGLECGCVGWGSTSHGQLHCDTGTSYVPAWPRQNANVLSKTLAATKLNS